MNFQYHFNVNINKDNKHKVEDVLQAMSDSSYVADDPVENDAVPAQKNVQMQTIKHPKQTGSGIRIKSKFTRGDTTAGDYNSNNELLALPSK